MILTMFLQSLSAELTTKEVSEDLDGDGALDYHKTSYFRHESKILEKTQVLNLPSGKQDIWVAYIDGASVLIVSKREFHLATMIFRPTEATEFIQFFKGDDISKKRIGFYSTDNSDHIELYAIDSEGGLIPASDHEHSEFASEIGVANSFTKAVLEEKDPEKALDVVETFRKKQSNKSGDGQ